MTFNIHHGVGTDGRHDLPRLATLLASVDADVICLQEVDRHYGDRTEEVDQALLLSRALDMQLAWGPAIDEPGPKGKPHRQYGNALLSRLPILISDVHQLPGGGEPRCALRTMIELDGGALWVTNTHLTTRSAEERAMQVGGDRRPAHRADGDRRAGRRLQHLPGRTGARPPARALHRCLAPRPGARRPGRLAVLEPGRRGHVPGPITAQALSTRPGSPGASRSPPRRSWTPRAPPTTCRSSSTSRSAAGSRQRKLSYVGPIRRYTSLAGAAGQAVSSSRSRWLMTPVMPSPRMLTP